MAIGIIGAMEEEVEGLRSLMQEPKTKMIAHTELIEGMLDGKKVVLVKSGIGKVNAALSTTLLLSQYDIDHVINIGSAGGADESMEVGTVVISDVVTHHDMDATVFGYVPGQVPQMPEVYEADETLITLAERAVEELDKYPSAKGLIASGDVFMSDAVRVKEACTTFPNMIAFEMEAAAVAQVCHQFDCPFVVIRALSDIAGKESSISFDEFLPLAASHSIAIVRNVLSKL